MNDEYETKPGQPESEPAWIETILPDVATGDLADVMAGIAGRSGSVANILLCQSLHPEGLRDHNALYRTLMFGRGALSRAERESIAVSVSSANGCRY
jgi:alkylhydroperoxidase family enzyme